jgi:hypothetical protein
LFKVSPKYADFCWLEEQKRWNRVIDNTIFRQYVAHNRSPGWTIWDIPYEGYLDILAASLNKPDQRHREMSNRRKDEHKSVAGQPPHEYLPVLYEHMKKPVDPVPMFDANGIEVERLS